MSPVLEEITNKIKKDMANLLSEDICNKIFTLSPNNKRKMIKLGSLKDLDKLKEKNDER